MRINYALPSDVLTGGVRVIFEIANRLVARGHDVSITIPGKRTRGFSFSGTFIAAPRPLARALLSSALERIHMIPDVAEYRFSFLEQIMPDCDANIATFCRTAFPVFRSGKGHPVYHMQHYEPLFFNDDRTKKIAQETYYLPMKRIANSAWLQQLLKESMGIESTLICPAIDHSVFFPRKEIRNQSRRRVVAFAKQQDWKGTPDLLDAMKRVFASRKDVELVLYGSSRVTYMKEGVPYKFVLRPSDEDLARLYASADVVVCPSWYESFPLPPIEAMACGAPVVTTRIGTEDYAVHEDNCLVVQARDPKAMADAIMTVLDEESIAERFRKKGPVTAERFTWDRTVDDVETTLRDVTK